MPERKPVRISIGGVDGAGKDTVRKRAMEYLGDEMYPILYIGKPSLIITRGGEQPVQAGLTNDTGQVA